MLELGVRHQPAVREEVTLNGRGRWRHSPGGVHADPRFCEAESDHLDGVGRFFFQAEDGIRDHYVTGVQTCALPILLTRSVNAGFSGGEKKRNEILQLAV